MHLRVFKRFLIYLRACELFIHVHIFKRFLVYLRACKHTCTCFSEVSYIFESLWTLIHVHVFKRFLIHLRACELLCMYMFSEISYIFESLWTFIHVHVFKRFLIYLRACELLYMYMFLKGFLYIWEVVNFYTCACMCNLNFLLVYSFQVAVLYSVMSCVFYVNLNPMVGAILNFRSKQKQTHFHMLRFQTGKWKPIILFFIFLLFLMSFNIILLIN